MWLANLRSNPEAVTVVRKFSYVMLTGILLITMVARKCRILYVWKVVISSTATSLITMLHVALSIGFVGEPATRNAAIKLSHSAVLRNVSV